MTAGEKTIAFVLYPGLTPLDIVGPLQVMTVLRTFVPDWHTVVVAENLEPMATDAGPALVAEATFGDVPEPMVLLTPGGAAPTVAQMGNTRLLDYLSSVAPRAEVIASVCTGALLLAAAGLLEGRRATTHWAYHWVLERLGATYVAERWVEDGKFMTSAGVSAGIDMALQLVARLTDEATARFVQLGIEYDPQPPFGAIEWDRVDRDMFRSAISQQVQDELHEHPQLQNRLLA